MSERASGRDSQRDPIEVVHLDLGAGPLDEAANVVATRRAVRLVIWRGDLPIGEVELPAGGRRPTPGGLRQFVAQAVAPAVGQRLLGDWFDPSLPERHRSRPTPPPPVVADLASLHDPIARLGASDDGRDLGGLTISVVVCTRDRPAELKRALAALTRLDPAPSEVLVVDNAPTSRAAEDVVARFPGIRRVVEPRPGLARARNAGVRATTGDVVAFTDDDVDVAPGWVGRLVGAFTGPEVMAVAGLVLPSRLDTEGEVLFETHLGGFGQGYRARIFDRRFFEGMRPLGPTVWRIGAGANMAMRRTVFDRLGGFDERLGAGAAGCSEDSELWYRVLAEGWVCRYDPSAVVWHRHRGDIQALRRQAFDYLRGHVTALFVQYGRHHNVGDLRRALVGLPSWYGRRLLRAAVAADPTITAEAGGYLAGLARLRTALRPPGPVNAIGRARLGPFLARNPFPNPSTEGFYFRDKMRAIHRVAPPGPVRRVVEVGGGRSGLTSLLYPGAEVVTVDLAFGPGGPTSPALVSADAARLPFADATFDAATFFDVLEHIPDDDAAVRETLRVLVPGGAVLVTAPNEHWRFPFHRALASICPTDAEVMAEWGHVRRGYRLAELDELIGTTALRQATFINRFVSVNHDIAFSRLPARARQVALVALAPVSWAAYAIHRPGWRGTETAGAWRAPLAARHVVPASPASPTAPDAA